MAIAMVPLERECTLPLQSTIYTFFTPIGSSGYGDCNGTFRKRMCSSFVHAHPGTRLPPAKHCAQKNMFDC